MQNNLPKFLAKDKQDSTLKLFLDWTYASTTAYDVSWQGNNWTLTNTPVFTRKMWWKWWTYNWSSQYITFPNITWILTVCFWIYPTANNDNIILLSTWNSINISSTDTITVTWLTLTTAYVNWTNSIWVNQNKWNFVCCTISSANSTSWNIANSQFTWNIINPMIFSRVLTQTEIQELYLSTWELTF